jgi:predicted DNA binding CopG/RHH family protein
MKEKSTERITARISKTHLKMVKELKENCSINFSQLMRNAIETEYKKQKDNENI